MKIQDYKVGQMHSGSKLHAVVERKLPHTGDYIHHLPICKLSTRGTVESASLAPEGSTVNCLRCLSRAKKLEEMRAKKAEKQAKQAAALEYGQLQTVARRLGVRLNDRVGGDHFPRTLEDLRQAVRKAEQHEAAGKELDAQIAAKKALEEKKAAEDVGFGDKLEKDQVEKLAETCMLVSWDWKETPSADEVNAALLFVGKHHKVVTFYDVEDTGGDQGAWVVGPEGLMEEVVTLVFLELVQQG